MSEMAKNARAAMKAKATRMGGKGDPKAKVDASSWSPPEMMNTGAKVGMRPLSRRAFRKGGKVIEKCEGGPAAMRADRKQRKAGGRATSLVTDMINRNVKKANKYREGGDAHVGGYKSGGDVEQDKKLVKKAFAQHDKNMHGGKHEDIKLKKGGAARDKYNLNDRGKPRTDEGERPASSGARGVPGLRVTRPSLTERVMNDRDDEPRYRKGGAAEKGGRTKKAAGGTPPADTAPEPEPYEAWRKLQTGKGPAPGQNDKTSPPGGTMMPKKAKGGGTYYGGTRPTGGRMPRKSGGRAKGKTNISITINPQQPQDQQQQAMMPKMPTPPPMPPPPIAPPGMGPGMPPMPMPMPPPGPPPGLAGGPPPGMPPMPRKRGGRAYRSYKDMDAGALGGMGRLEKVEIEHGKRVGRLSGGRARSYKDMDAGSLGGMGRIEKIAIQKHKR